MSRGIRHPFSRALYEALEENKVLVTTLDGKTGIFDRKGKHISGDLYDADPEMCIWVGSKQVATSQRMSKQE